MNSARMDAFRKRILADKTETTFDSAAFYSTIDKMSVEHQGPLYAAPSDIIDEFGRLKVGTNSSPTFQLPKHLETSGPDSFAKLALYMKKRFPERLLQARQLAASSEQVYTAWRSRTRKREAEWGDPEDLGLLPAHTAAGSNGEGFSSYGNGKNSTSNNNLVRLGEDKMSPEYPQLAVQPKQLLPNYFIDSSSFTTASRSLFQSARPSLFPVTPVARFNANTAVWSPAERKTFIELYLQNPKNFAKIAAQLPYKNCEQCVEFYYRHKKEYRLKQMVASYRKAMVAQRKLILNPSSSTNSSSIGTASNAANNNLNILPAAGNGNYAAEDDSGSGNNSSASGRKKTGRPVGRPKNKDKQK